MTRPQPEQARKSSLAPIAFFVVGSVAVGVILSVTGHRNPTQCSCLPPNLDSTPQTTATSAADLVAESDRGGRPRLLDLGADKCVPCKMMAPILDELKRDYRGRLDVVFIDVWQNRDAAPKYGIETIPTQIFFDASGKEIYRHTGFLAKEDILRKGQELGFDLSK